MDTGNLVSQFGTLSFALMHTAPRGLPRLICPAKISAMT
jgi:hypothetical protein